MLGGPGDASGRDDPANVPEPHYADRPSPLPAYEMPAPMTTPWAPAACVTSDESLAQLASRSGHRSANCRLPGARTVS